MAITDGLVGHWCPSLDDAGNGTTTLTDLSGNGNHGTLTNMDPATDWVTDTANGGVRALDFDGANDYVDLSTIDITSPHSISLWIYCRRFAQLDSAFTIGAEGTTNQLSIGCANSGNKFKVRYNTSTRVDTTSTVSTNIWYHIAGTWDGSTVTIYLDSVADGSGATSGTPPTGGGTSIGGTPIDSRWYLDARLDDIRIYNRVLTPTEITALASQRGYTETTNAAPQFQRRMQAGGVL